MIEWLLQIVEIRGMVKKKFFLICSLILSLLISTMLWFGRKMIEDIVIIGYKYKRNG